MGDSTPICRCRVLYLGSAVPRQSKDGLQGIQEPLRSLYPSEGAVGARGIDSWLSVWSNGILLENVDENRKQVTRFFPIESLHYCAAVRQVLIPERGNSNPEPKFLPLDSPFARAPRAQHPPIFAAILRRTTGIKVLECHVFICKREAAANALVRCCFHAYADNSYAKQLEGSNASSVYGTLGKPSNGLTATNGISEGGWRSRAGSTTTINSVGQRQMNGTTNGNGSGGGPIGNGGDAYTVKNMYASSADIDVVDDAGSIYNGDENHKVWSGSQDHLDDMHTENPYDFYGGNGMNGHSSTLGRTARARQISAPIPVPPPPKDETKKRKEKKSKNSSSQSLSGTLIRPKPVHGSTLVRGIPMHHQMVPMQHAAPPLGYGPPPLAAHHGQMASQRYHTFSHRGGYANGSTLGGSIPHHLHMIPMQMHHGPPIHHPMPVMLPQQYATLQNPRNTNKKKKKDKMSNGIPLGIPVPPPLFAYPPSMIHEREPRPLAMSNRKLAQSAGAGLDDSGNSGAESPGGTGIYRRKGHLNERAFSYSIRQEHRSRSHGSLASLQFNPPDVKKEREIAQMMAGLELNDDATIYRRTQQSQQQQMQQSQQQPSNQMHHQSTMVMPMNGGTFGKHQRK